VCRPFSGIRNPNGAGLWHGKRILAAQDGELAVT
jgi:hypothetical protein